MYFVERVLEILFFWNEKFRYKFDSDRNDYETDKKFEYLTSVGKYYFCMQETLLKLLFDFLFHSF